MSELGPHRRSRVRGRPRRPLVASASEDHTVLLWAWPGAAAGPCWRTPTRSTPWLSPVPGEVSELPAGHRLRTGSRLWSLSAAGAVKGPRLFPGHEGVIRAVAFSPDGRRVPRAGRTAGSVYGTWRAGDESPGWGATPRRGAGPPGGRDLDSLSPRRPAGLGRAGQHAQDLEARGPQGPAGGRASRADRGRWPPGRQPRRPVGPVRPGRRAADS